MRRTPILAAVAFATALGVLSGCGTTAGPAAPGGAGHAVVNAAPAADTTSTAAGAQLLAGIAALGRRSTLTATAGLDASPTTVSAAASSLGHPLTTAQALALSGLRVSRELLAPEGDTVADLRGHPAKGSRAFTVASHGTSYLQLRRVHGTYYLRGDIKDALVLTGHRALWQTLKANEASLPTFLRALAKGRWISLSPATAKLIKRAIGQRITIPTPAQITSLLRDIRAVLIRDVTVTQVGSDTDSRTTHFLLTASAATIGPDLLAVIRKDLPALATRMSARLSARHPAAEGGRVTVRATLTGGVLTELRTNLAALDPALGTTAVPLVLHFRRSGPPIAAPAHSTPVDLSGLLGLAGLLGRRAGA
jgi:hypothetical protein